MLWLSSAVAAAVVGMAVVALADQAARDGSRWAAAGFWVGITITMAAAIVPVVLGPSDQSILRQIVVLDAMALYCVKLLVSPYQFTFHDEFGHLRVTDDILRSHHLLSASPLVQAFPYFPGLDAATAELVRLSGLSVFTAGIIVVAIAKLIEAVLLFETFRILLRNTRAAGVGAVVYFTNPSYVFFDSQYSYESLALAFSIAIAWTLVRGVYETHRPLVAEAVSIAVIGSALVVTHHMTTYLVATMCTVIGAVALVSRQRRSAALVGGTGVMLVVLAAAWALTEATVVESYLGSVLGPAVSHLLGLLEGGSSGKTLFQSRSGTTLALPYRLLAIASAGIAGLGCIAGGLLLWRRRPLGLGVSALLGLAVLYPFTVLLRLTAAGTEASTRASAFVFVGVAACVATATVAALDRARTRWATSAIGASAAVGVAVLAAGGLVVGWAPYALQPGPFLVSADQRSITKEGVSTALWVPSWIGPHARIAADRENRLLLGSYGHADPQAIDAEAIAVPELYFSRSVTAHDLEILRRDRLRYVLVDRRLTLGPPVVGAYFQPAERQPPHGPLRTLTTHEIDKFGHSRWFNRIFDNGAIRIYQFTGGGS